MALPSRQPARHEPGLGECLAVFGLLGFVAVEILVTYSRLPASELYHVSGSGIVGGASRVLVFLCFPCGLVTLAILGILFDRLPGRGSQTVAVLAAAACATVFWPGIVDQANLDARPANAIAALGVAAALALTVAVATRVGARMRPWRRPGDPVRLVVAGFLLLVSMPWLAADLGFYLDRVPLLGWIFETNAYPAEPSRPPPGLEAAVHHGHHHGLDGLLLCLCALVLSRGLGAVVRRGLRAALTGYLALMLAYGAWNVANDAWLEQIVKRDWTDWTIPSVLVPEPTVAWGLLLLVTGAIWLAWRAVPSEP